ncbi:MAG TPA: CopD family protein [Anaerolineales bacterium]|nr:CopD family protein [Anaerolineales bacterium]
MPDWIIAAAYFFHMVATVVWVGGITMLTLIVYPSLRKVSGNDSLKGTLISEIHRRFSPLAMISLATLIVTGLSQMAVNPNYKGLLVIDNAWSWAILIKHVAFGVMALIGGYSVWGLTPAIHRLALLESKGKLSGDELASLRQREERLNQLNFACALVVLLLTAVARAA